MVGNAAGAMGGPAARIAGGAAGLVAGAAAGNAVNEMRRRCRWKRRHLSLSPYNSLNTLYFISKLTSIYTLFSLYSYS